MIKISLFFITDVTDYPHFELPLMVCDNDYRAKIFFILRVKSMILCLSIFSLVDDCLILKNIKKLLVFFWASKGILFIVINKAYIRILSTRVTKIKINWTNSLTLRLNKKQNFFITQEMLKPSK